MVGYLFRQLCRAAKNPRTWWKAIQHYILGDEDDTMLEPDVICDLDWWESTPFEEITEKINGTPAHELMKLCPDGFSSPLFMYISRANDEKEKKSKLAIDEFLRRQNDDT